MNGRSRPRFRGSRYRAALGARGTPRLRDDSIIPDRPPLRPRALRLREFRGHLVRVPFGRHLLDEAATTPICQSSFFDRSLSTPVLRLTQRQCGLTQLRARLTDRYARPTQRTPRLTHRFSACNYLKCWGPRVYRVNPPLVTQNTRLVRRDIMIYWSRAPDWLLCAIDCGHPSERSAPGCGSGSASRNEGRVTARPRLSGPEAGGG